MELWELFWKPRSNLINMIKKDREELQITEMLANLWIWKKEQELAFA